MLDRAEQLKSGHNQAFSYLCELRPIVIYVHGKVLQWHMGKGQEEQRSEQHRSKTWSLAHTTVHTYTVGRPTTHQLCE